MGKTIIAVHGRAPKPGRRTLSRLWFEALRSGIQRDHPQEISRFDRATFSFVYFGHVTGRFFKAHGLEADYAPSKDARSRRDTLRTLKAYRREEFFNREVYDRLPGKNAFKELVADAFGGLLSKIRLSELVIGGFAPDVKEYWNFDSGLASDARWPLIGPLVKAMERRDTILLLAHSLGSMIAWDTLWKFARAAEYRPRYTRKKIDLFLTIGSPLADDTVRRYLKGARAQGPRRYPTNVKRWINVAAEDDYVSHDQSVADDYSPMLENGLVQSIEDRRIYNLAVRSGRSNPHHSGGYLIHPVVADVVAGWL
jgi:hypothetical protein